MKQNRTAIDTFKRRITGIVKKINWELTKSKNKQTVRIKNRVPFLYAKFDELYRINPTNTKQYVNQYKNDKA